jgi:DNA-binding response OmpR family regulator
MAKKILFIEDEMRLQEALAAKLKAEGYEVISALDGESGFKMAEENKPDLILLDLILPKKDGFKVLEELKAKPEISAIPVIVLTNLEDKKDIQRCLALGVRSYLAKANYSLNEVAQKVDEVFKGVFK